MQSRQELLVFPTSRSIREYVNSQKEFNTLLPTIITIDEFLKKSLYYENKKLIDEEERFLFLKEAVKNTKLSNLGISKNFTHFIKQSDYIYRFFLELASENIDIESISNADTYGFYSEHLEILKQIHNNFLDILDKNRAIDRVNQSKHFKINSDFLNRYSEVKLHFEGYFTLFEFEIIKEISKITNLKINFIYNTFNKKSIERFINYRIDLDIEHLYEIDFSKKEILKKEILKNKYENLVLRGFSSRINQIAFIKESIVNYVNKGINPSKIAVILPDEKFALTLSLFDNERYFNYAMGLNIYTSKLYKVIDAIYQYINDDEIKNEKNLKFLELDVDEINKIFKNNWNKNLTTELFEKIIEFFITKENNKELIEKFKEMIYKSYKLFFSYGDKILLKEAYRLISQKLSEITLDDVNSGKITVMGLLESRLIDFEAIIICDFNESLIPKRSVKDKFLSTTIKKNVNLPTALDRENLQKYYYKKLISNTKEVSISYVKNDNEQISRFANTLFDTKIDDKVYDNKYKHILYSSNKLEHFNKDIIQDIDLSKTTWSASSLKEYLECKRKYYFNYILKIKEHDISLKPKGYELGNIVHKSLELYYKQEIRTNKKLLEIFNNNRSENLFLNLDLEIWKKKLENFVEFENNRFENGFKIVDLERTFSFSFEGINLRGTIDRIDKKDDKYYVLDYKTSANLKVDSKKTYEKSNDFQLEFYYLAVENLYKTQNINTYYYDLSNMKLLEEVVLEEKLELLRKIFLEFNTNKVSFDKCENNQVCQYCTYKIICNKD